MATASQVLDKRHGFLQVIINNQFERREHNLVMEDDKIRRKKEADLEPVQGQNKAKVERRKRREAIPTRGTYVPPSQRKVQTTPPRYLGKTVFKMEVEYKSGKFAPIRIRETECIKKACQLFCSRYEVEVEMVPTLEAHISLQMGLLSFE